MVYYLTLLVINTSTNLDTQRLKLHAIHNDLMNWIQYKHKFRHAQTEITCHTQWPIAEYKFQTTLQYIEHFIVLITSG
jgi:hypothetical protein